MIMSLAPRRSVNPFRGLFLPAPAGRHRLQRLGLPRRMVLAIVGYVGVWAAWSTVATMAAVR